MFISLCTVLPLILTSYTKIYTLNYATVNYKSIATSSTSKEEKVEVKQYIGEEIETQFDSNQKPTCQRQCSHRKNIISYIDSPSGLSDRKAIIKDLAQLAGYLCAELVLPPPSVNLSIKHNYKELVSNSVAWSDLYNITFMDGSHAIRSLDINSTKNYSVQQQHQDHYHSWSDVPVFSTSGGTSKYKDWLHIVSTDGKTKEDFRTVQNFSFRQEIDTIEKHKHTKKDPTTTAGFIWEIHKKWYQSDLWEQKLPELLRSIKQGLKEGHHHNDMMPYLFQYYKFHPEIRESKRQGCRYTNTDTVPSHIKTMQKRLVRRIIRNSVDNTKHGILHVRRKDTIHECDTSVDRMREFLACSLNGTDSLGSNLTILLTSDEEDVEYRHEIIELADRYRHVSILDADELVKNIVHEAVKNGVIDKGLDNNYYIFEVEQVLRGWENDFVKFHLVRRRSNKCKDCINLNSQLSTLNN